MTAAVFASDSRSSYLCGKPIDVTARLSASTLASNSLIVLFFKIHWHFLSIS